MTGCRWCSARNNCRCGYQAGREPNCLSRRRRTCFARNDLSVAQATRSALEQRLRGEEAEIERARRVLDEAVREVVRLEVPVADMLAAAQGLQNELISARIVLRQLYKSSCIPSDSVKAIESFLRDAALPAGAGVVERADFDRHPAALPWQNAIEQLRVDAEAKLPSV